MNGDYAPVGAQTNTDAVSDERLAALIHTQRASARILRERGSAMHGYHPSWADHMDTVADTLELLSSRSASNTGGVEVKALEWRKSNAADRWVASHPWGEVEIIHDTRSQDFPFGWFVGGVWFWCKTLEEAQANTQSNFTQRILSALDMEENRPYIQRSPTMVRVSQVLDNAGYLYPRDTLVVIRQNDEMYLLETSQGARRWVHQSFLRNEDGSQFEAGENRHQSVVTRAFSGQNSLEGNQPPHPSNSLAAEAEPVAWGLLDANGVVIDANVMKSQFEYLNTPDRVIPLRPAIPVSAEVTATHRHVKRGTEYVLIGFGKVQAEWWLDELLPDPERGNQSVDMREVAVYRSVDDGSLWVRPREEFEDGRFVSLSSINGVREK